MDMFIFSFCLCILFLSVATLMGVNTNKNSILVILYVVSFFISSKIAYTIPELVVWNFKFSIWNLF